MASYSVVIADSALKELTRIPKRYRARVVRRIGGLAQDPRPPGCQKLSEQGRYRLRQGPYRVVYQVLDDTHTVDIVKVGHRREIYR
ncbi:MAG: type II toxin-antitoxin system RelE/ParE family toxin [Dehalococcoidia bacterium]|nr:type II toxin-antitoxin system RelE/ParE family toxin [Dehalococcoidia bacterium]